MAGVENVVADALSCQYDDMSGTAIINTVAHRLADIDLEQLGADQDADRIPANMTDTLLDVTRIGFLGISTEL